MLKAKRLASLAAVAAAGLLAAGLAVAGPAGASTSGCTGGVYTGYCGTEQDLESTPVSWDVLQQHKTVNTPVVGYADSDSDQATDFYVFAYDGGSSKIFEYAPSGVASNLCVSEPSFHAGLVLRGCNGSAFQRFTAASSGAGYTWTDQATGDIVQGNGYDKQLSGVTGTASSTVQQEFNFQS